MKKTAIKNLLREDLVIVNIKKYPSDNLLEFFFGQWDSILTVIYFFMFRKKNQLIITPNRILFLIRQKVVNDIKIIKDSRFHFDFKRPKIEILNQGLPDQVIILEKMNLSDSEKNRILSKLKKSKLVLE
ncbi:hypothetical protein [Dokdonia sp.]|uniref:hypothetical protein n=1 Tax=Dokdonia sp. TaxID=2024995 RepID=UPI003262F6DE